MIKQSNPLDFADALRDTTADAIAKSDNSASAGRLGLHDLADVVGETAVEASKEKQSTGGVGGGIGRNGIEFDIGNYIDKYEQASGGE